MNVRNWTEEEDKYIQNNFGKITLTEMSTYLKCSIARQENRALIKMRHPRNTRKLKDFIEE